MPNYTVNQIRASKEVIDALINTEPGSDYENSVDFNLLIPTPEDIYQGPLGQAERELYGDRNWYDWNVENWGTKWNAGSTVRSSDKSVYFDTAWDRPEPVLIALSKKFPLEKILVRYSDEGSYNAGCYFLLDGEEIEDPRNPQLKDHDSVIRFIYKLRNGKFA